MSEALVERLRVAVEEANRIEALEREVAAKDEAYIKAWNERDAQRRRAEAAERKVAELEAELTRKHEAFSIAHDQAMQNGQAAAAAEADKARLSEALGPDALASTVANIRQGESSTPRCEPPSAYDVDVARAWTARVLKAIGLRRAALSGSSSGGWRTMDSAPKDGTVILAVSNDAQRPRVIATWWHDGWWRSYKPTLDKFETENPFRWFPTHWMPLPTAPQPTGGE